MVATRLPSSNKARSGEVPPYLPKKPETVGNALEHVFKALNEAEVFFGHGTDNPWDEAVQLVLCACNYPVDSGQEVRHERIYEEQWRLVCQWLARRVSEREPLPYITGEAWFAGLRFKSDPRALVPRSPLGELIARDYAPWWGGERQPAELLDLCCGGGAIGIAAAVQLPALRVTLADLDKEALKLAAENIALHGLDDRVSLYQSDLFSALDTQRFDVILCNPPYVDALDLDQMPDEYRAEPPQGLGSGEDGLAHTRLILRKAAEHLTADGLLFLEVGNSWVALDELLAGFPLTWLEFENGGHGVLVIGRDELVELNGFLAGT